MINTSTALRSAAGRGGAFDTPKAKCPPDGGSQICVTGKSAFSMTPDIGRISTGISIAKDPYQRNPVPISTPPLSPDDGGSTASSLSSISSFDLHAPPELVTALFPRAGIRVAAYAKAVSVSGDGASFDGFVLDLPKHFPGANPKAAFVRTLFVDGRGAESVQLRESIVAMLDLADEHLSCQAFVIALDKTSSSLGHLIHSLMYVGGTVVTQPPMEVDRSFVLVGIDI